ncbi:hypothetical protein B0H19DRAFT_1168074 [Mycena capillaripes]|nr:hypothetical protein B0H19DRAFT_1168074 [Mycena capillaripes]
MPARLFSLASTSILLQNSPCVQAVLYQVLKADCRAFLAFWVFAAFLPLVLSRSSSSAQAMIRPKPIITCFSLWVKPGCRAIDQTTNGNRKDHRSLGSIGGKRGRVYMGNLHCFTGAYSFIPIIFSF